MIANHDYVIDYVYICTYIHTYDVYVYVYVSPTWHANDSSAGT